MFIVPLDNETDLRELREIKQQINDINYFNQAWNKRFGNQQMMNLE